MKKGSKFSHFLTLTPRLRLLWLPELRDEVEDIVGDQTNPIWWKILCAYCSLALPPITHNVSLQIMQEYKARSDLTFWVPIFLNNDSTFSSAELTRPFFYWHKLPIDQQNHFGNAEFTLNFWILRSNGRVADCDWTPIILTKSLLGQTFQFIPEIWRIPLSSNNEKGFYWGKSGSQKDLPIHWGKRCIRAITRARHSKCWITIAFPASFLFCHLPTSNFRSTLEAP